MQPRHNLQRMPWIKDLTSSGEALLEGGRKIPVDSIVYCTGYKYSFPFLEGSGLVETGTFQFIEKGTAGFSVHCKCELHEVVLPQRQRLGSEHWT